MTIVSGTIRQLPSIWIPAIRRIPHCGRTISLVVGVPYLYMPMGKQAGQEHQEQPPVKPQKLSFRMPSFQYLPSTKPRHENRIKAMANMPYTPNRAVWA